MTESELQAIETRANAATPGPWKSLKFGEYVFGPGVRLFAAATAQDAEFVSLARADVPALLSEVRRLEEQNERLRRDRYDLLNATTAEGWSAAEWQMRTATAERRARDAEAERDVRQAALNISERLPRYSTEAVDALVTMLAEHVVGLFTAHLQTSPGHAIPDELKALDDALVAVRASREPR